MYHIKAIVLIAIKKENHVFQMTKNHYRSFLDFMVTPVTLKKSESHFGWIQQFVFRSVDFTAHDKKS